MPEQDALSTFDFDKVAGAGLFVKFQAGKPITVRVLTIDPIVSSTEFTDKQTGEVTLSTRFAFIIYNFTEEKAQILQASPAMARKIGELHVDPDFGANIRKIDIKISPTGEGKERRYDIQVLPTPKDLTADMVKEAQNLPLEEKVKGDRMSLYDPNAAREPNKAAEQGNDGEPLPEEPSGYDTAKAEAEKHRKDDVVIEDIGEEPINLDDIPF